MMRWFACFVALGLGSTVALLLDDRGVYETLGAVILIATGLFASVSLAAWARRRVRRDAPAPTVAGVVLPQEWKLFVRAIDGLVSGRRKPPR